MRALAAGLVVSPGTAAAAYRALQARGVIASDGRRGTIVRHAPTVVRSMARAEVPPGLRDLIDGNPDRTLLPPLSSALDRLPRDTMMYGGRALDAELETLASASLRADGVRAHEIVMANGALDAIERALGVQVRPGDRVAVEDPVYPPHLDLLGAMGLIAEPVAIDRFGMRPELLARALQRGACAIIATPRAQNPTGAAFDHERQAALRAILDEHPQVFVIEDDHAWLVAGVAYRTLCKARERWFVVRSFSKAFGPDLRVAFASGDATTISRFRGRQQLGAGWVSHISQSIARMLWVEPGTERLIEHASRLYAQRRSALVGAFAAEGIVVGGASGFACWVPVSDEARAVVALRDAGFAVAPGQRFRIHAPPGIRISIARLDVDDAPAIARTVAASERATASTRST